MDDVVAISLSLSQHLSNQALLPAELTYKVMVDEPENGVNLCSGP